LLAANVAAKATPVAPAKVVGLVIAEKLPIVITRFRGRLLPYELDAVSEMVATCGSDGVPLISPVDVLSESPDGRPTAAKEVGEFVAVIV
jgi:hypothetical protein